MKYVVAAFLFVSLLFSPSLRSTKEELVTISLVQLLVDPEKFDHKSVTVSGYLLMENQPHHSPGASLFLHREDGDNLLGNLVPLEPSERMLREEEKIDRMYVNLTGTVRVAHAVNGGTMVAIVDIQHCDLWSDPNRPIGLKGDKSKPSPYRP
jgi:hypothetical protein